MRCHDQPSRHAVGYCRTKVAANKVKPGVDSGGAAGGGDDLTFVYVEDVGNELHPIGKVQDFSPYVQKIVSSGADAVITGNWGADMVNLAKAANDITMLDIVEAVDGPVRGLAPFASTDSDGGLDKKLDQICSQAADQTRKQLQKVRVSELAGKK